jgi:hypothetical protein
MLAVDFQRGLTNAWNDVIVFIPKFIALVIIVVVGWIVAKIVAQAVRALLRRTGIDGWAGSGPLRRLWSSSPFTASDLLAAAVRWAISLLAVDLALGIFGPNSFSSALAAIVAYIPRIALAVLILAVTMGLARWIEDVASASLREVDGGRPIAVGAGIAIAVFGIFAALDELEVAPMVVVGLFYATLAVVVGASVIAFGVGGIPVARRWLERASVNAERTGHGIRGTTWVSDPTRTEDLGSPKRDRVMQGSRAAGSRTQGEEGSERTREETVWP